MASGEPLPLAQGDLAIHGWAIEARLYAEDPAKGFLPSIGPLEAFDLGDAVRVDTGVAEGGRVSPFYDPMIAKLIAHGDTREGARVQLADALADAVVWPVRTNAGLPRHGAGASRFVDGTVDTGLIAREGEGLMPPAFPSGEGLAAAAAELVGETRLGGFHLNAPRRAPCRYWWTGGDGGGPARYGGYR